MNSIVNSVILIVVAATITFLLRALPFLIFGGKSKMPDGVKKVSDMLPAAIMAVLVVYCVKSDIFSVKEMLLNGMNYCRENIASPIAACAALVAVSVVHLWKRKTLLSIFIGTLIYMILIRVI